MIRSLAIVMAAGLLVSAIVGPVYGIEAALTMAGLVAAVSAVGMAVAHRTVRRGSQRPLRTRFVVVVAIAVGLILVAVLAAAELMFVSNHDALMISAAVLAAGLVAMHAAHVASAGVVSEIMSLRDVLQAVGAGEREPRVGGGSAAELTQVAEAANTMIDRLAEEEARRDAADGARRHLVAAISHDLRTPMTALRLMVDAIDDGLVDDATRRRYLATIRMHIGMLGALIDDLFELSRLEAGDLEWSIRQVELVELVDETVVAMRVAAEAKGVVVASELPDAPQTARANPEQLQRVLFNLIQNAIRHTPADGSVTVRAECDGEWIEIEVSDTGDGIAVEDRERVFDAFFRGDAARLGDGAGLGLAISRAIIEAHGGRIWLAAADVGTRVCFVIPA